jgi:hypothetical protein
MRKESSQTINTPFVKKTQSVLSQVLRLVKYLKLPLPDHPNIHKNQTVTPTNFKSQIDTMQSLFQVFTEFYRTEKNNLSILTLENYQLDLTQNPKPAPPKTKATAEQGRSLNTHFHMPHRSMPDIQEVPNHKKLIQILYERFQNLSSKKILTQSQILNLNTQKSESLSNLSNLTIEINRLECSNRHLLSQINNFGKEKNFEKRNRESGNSEVDLVTRLEGLRRREKDLVGRNGKVGVEIKNLDLVCEREKEVKLGLKAENCGLVKKKEI